MALQGTRRWTLETPSRLVDALRALGLSEREAEAEIRRGAVFVDGRRDTRPGRRLPAGSALVWHPKPIDASPNMVRLYENADLLVVAKPPGLHVNPTQTRPEAALLELLGPGFHLVHRLDKDTSGLLLLAKHPAAAKALSARFQARSIHKSYVAAVTHALSALRAEFPIGPDSRRPRARRVQANGKASLTEFEVLAIAPELGLIRARPITGRTHQIRVHAAALGAPLFGDSLYGGVTASRLAGEVLRAARPMLHAESLVIDDWPAPNRFFCPWPEDLCALAEPLGVVAPRSIEELAQVV